MISESGSLAFRLLLLRVLLSVSEQQCCVLLIAVCSVLFVCSVSAIAGIRRLSLH
jgi:hypothetical protein